MKLSRALWRHPRHAVIAAAAVLALAVAATVAGFSWYERSTVLAQARERGELLARLFTDQVSRVVDSSSLLLGALGELVQRQGAAEIGSLGPQFTQALLGQRELRSVALLDAQGRVLLSSNRAELGLLVDLDGLGARADAAGEQIGGVLAGRGLADLAVAPGHAAAPQPAPGVTMLPLLKPLRDARGQRLLLVALLNPEAFANYQQTSLGEIPAAVLLSSYEGRLLEASEGVALQPGARLDTSPVFTQWLPAREHGSFSGPGARPGRQLLSYRAVRNRPLVLLVEQSESAVLAGWRELAVWRALVGVAAMLAIALGAWVLLRSLRAREHSRAALDRAHETVAQRERELSVLMKSVQELIFRTDASGRLSFVNARWAAFYPGEVTQALGRRLDELVEPAYRHRVAQLFAGIGDAGLRSVEAAVRGADGSLRRFYFAVVPLHAQGRLIGFAGSATDVTERHAAQQRLRQELAFTALLLEVSPQPIALLDAAGRYATVNRAWESFTGHQRERVVGLAALAPLPAHEREIHEAQQRRLLSGESPLRYEMKISHRDGSARDVLVTRVLLRDELGAVTGTLATLMDVSDFRDAERATREARDAAEQASRAKSEFIANISHELRTPLQSILGFSELGGARSRDAPKIAAMFGDIHASGQRMLALVNDLLDVSKIESAVGTLELERCDLRGLLRSVRHELEPLTAQRRLHVALRLPAEALVAKVDPLRFQQVVRNVMANAIRFSPPDGLIEIEAGSTPAGEARIAIADRGPGIPAGEIETIFEAFVQSSRTKDGAGGTGLGLAICRKIVEIFGGRIVAANRPGGGAVFTLHLPLRSYGDTQPATLAPAGDTTLPAELAMQSTLAMNL